MSKTKVCKPHDPIDYLESKEDYELYLKSCFESDPGDCSLIKSAILDIAQAKGMAEVARESDLTRECLCKALSSEESPEFERITQILSALGLSMSDLVQMRLTKPRSVEGLSFNTYFPKEETLEALNEKVDNLLEYSSFSELLKEIDKELASECSSK